MLVAEAEGMENDLRLLKRKARNGITAAEEHVSVNDHASLLLSLLLDDLQQKSCWCCCRGQSKPRLKRGHCLCCRSCADEG